MSERAQPPEAKQNPLAVSAQLVKVRPPVQRSTHSPPPANGETLTAEPVVLPSAAEPAPAAPPPVEHTATDDTAPPASASSLKTPNIANLPPPTEPLELFVRNPNRYEILGEHGRGGIGRVLRARDRDLGRSVAVKELQKSSRTAEARFVREAMITARLQHPGIVPIHEAGRWPDGTAFYSMKLVEGDSLKQKIAACTNLGQRLALIPNLLAVADAVAYAHSQRVVHRDLKPSNVIVGEFGETVVIDWGLAKDLDEVTETISQTLPYRVSPLSELTMTGAIIGTAAYMAPEQARGESVDERADVYALGAMLYQALSSSAPYSGQSSAEILAKVLSIPPRSLFEVAAEVPAELITIVEKAMARDPEARYTSAKALAADLRRFQSGEMVRAYTYTPAERLIRWLRTHRTIAVGLAATLATVAVAATVAYARVSRERDISDRERREAVRQTNALVLTHARHALASDPTESLAWLKTFGGAEWDQVRDLAAEAIGRGYARRVLKAHRATALSVEPLADGGLLTHGRDWRLRLYRGQEDAAEELGVAHAELDVRMSPDDRFVAMRGEEGLVSVVSVHSGERIELSHGGFVYDVRFGQRGRLYTAANDGLVRVWDWPSARLHRELAAHEGGAFNVVALAGDGQLVSCGKDERLLLWDVETSSSRAVGECHTTYEIGSSVAASPSALSFVAPNAEHELVQWTVASNGNVQARYLAKFAGPVSEAVFSRTGRYAGATSLDGTGIVWSVAAPEAPFLVAHSAPVYRISFAPDETFVVTADEAGNILVTGLDTGLVRHRFKADSTVWDLAVARDSKSIYTASQSGEVRVWPLPALPAAAFQESKDRLLAVAMSPDARYVATHARDGVLRMRNMVTGQLWVVADSNYAAGRQLAFAPDGRALFFVDDTGKLAAWSVRRGARIELPTTKRVVDFQVGGNSLLLLDEGGEVAILDLEARQLRVIPMSGVASAIAISSDGATVAIGHIDGTVDLVGAVGEVRRTVNMAKSPIRQIAYRSEGDHLVALSDDALHESRGKHGPKAVLAFGPNVATSIVSSAGAVAVLVENVLHVCFNEEWRPFRIQARARRLALHAHAPWVAAGAENGVIYLWNLETGAAGTLVGHSAQVNALEFGAAAPKLASAGRDGQMMVWDLSSVVLTPEDPMRLRRMLSELTNYQPKEKP